MTSPRSSLRSRLKKCLAPLSASLSGPFAPLGKKAGVREESPSLQWFQKWSQKCLAPLSAHLSASLSGPLVLLGEKARARENGPNPKIRRRRQLRRLLRWAVLSGVACTAILVILAWAIPLPERLSQPPSTVVTFADGSPAYVFLAPDDRYRMAVRPEELSDIDGDYLDALFRFEDKRFFSHPGVDGLAVLRSAVVNVRLGRVASGASTLTMQLVRLLEPRPRTMKSKAIEALRALQLEMHLSKEEVLAAYLSFLPFGRNVEGLPAASYAYFGHGPEELSLDEIAVLLAVPQRPARRFPTDENQPALRQARDEIATWLLDEGYRVRDTPSSAPTVIASTAIAAPSSARTPQELIAAVQQANVPRQIRPLPRHAPHAAFWLRQQHRQQHHDKDDAGATLIETTLDRGLQLTAERMMARARRTLEHQGIHNGSVVLADHRKREIRALVGNFDFWDDDHGGQIVGFDTPRSPGSALKPFIYAMAIDRGLALPGHLVADIPVSYGDYAPANYDGEFAGLVPLEDALSHSLNIPFVRLLGKVGVERFIGTLQTSGAQHLRPEPGYYGLSAAIGSVDITPLEMASLYSSLAQDGLYRPLRWLQDDSAPALRRRAGTALFSPGSAHLTRRALARKDRPDFPQRRQLSGAPAAIHWKTGTSYGHRDAWAAGSGNDHSAVVWLGNFDNQSSVDLVGADAAGPLLFDLLEAVTDRSLPSGGDPPTRDLKRVEVCAYSGFLPNAACQQRQWAHALRHRVPTQRCPYHVALDVDLDSGLALNPSCRSGRRFERRSYVVWPASIRRWLAQGHRWLPSPPSLSPACQVTDERRPPTITSPPSGQVFVLMPGVPASQQEIPFSAETQGVEGEVSWFIDGEFLGKASVEERLWWQPEPGDHEILVLDAAGQSASQTLKVWARSESTETERSDITSTTASTTTEVTDSESSYPVNAPTLLARSVAAVDMP